MTASTTPETTTTTDANGAFRFEVTHSGSLSFTLSAEKACYETAPARSITLTDNTAYNAKAIELPPAPEPQGNDRFSLTPPGGPTYTLTIADCVRTIAAGEFTPTSVKVTDPDNPAAQIDAVTKLAVPLGSTNQNRKVRSIILPESLVRIGEKAFFDHQNVSTKLTIPASVDFIGKSSFQSVGALHTGEQSLEIPPNSKLKEIGDSAFNNSVVGTISSLPPTLKTIGESAFYQPAYGIQSSTNFIIPENITSVGAGAFAVGSSSVPRVSGKLTIRSPKLKRTPVEKTPDKTGTLGNYLFKGANLSTKPVNPFTTIALHEAVFDSYTKDDLEFIFGTGGRYVDILNETRELTKSP